MSFALYRFGTLIERHSTLQACIEAATKRGMVQSREVLLRDGGDVLREGVEIVDEDGQIDLEDAIAARKQRQ